MYGSEEQAIRRVILRLGQGSVALMMMMIMIMMIRIPMTTAIVRKTTRTRLPLSAWTSSRPCPVFVAATGVEQTKFGFSSQYQPSNCSMPRKGVWQGIDRVYDFWSNAPLSALSFSFCFRGLLVDYRG